jgi:hypothetical protein
MNKSSNDGFRVEPSYPPTYKAYDSRNTNIQNYQQQRFLSNTGADSSRYERKSYGDGLLTRSTTGRAGEHMYASPHRIPANTSTHLERNSEIQNMIKEKLSLKSSMVVPSQY